jgi:catechol 2,3-dioxygenase-like lactoylglutathione lyase family enzyme
VTGDHQPAGSLPSSSAPAGPAGEGGWKLSPRCRKPGLEVIMLETAVATTPVKVKKLGHFVYEVSDLDRSIRFWTEIMGFHISDRNERGMVFLRNGTDHHSIGLVPTPGLKRAKSGETLRFNHLAMEVADADTLFRIRDFLKQQGIPLTYEGRKGPGGNIGIEFEDPDGYGFELYADMDQVGTDGKTRPAEQWNRVTSLEAAQEQPLPSRW